FRNHIRNTERVMSGQPPFDSTTTHVGTAALGCPVEHSPTASAAERRQTWCLFSSTSGVQFSRVNYSAPTISENSRTQSSVKVWTLFFFVFACLLPSFAQSNSTA